MRCRLPFPFLFDQRSLDSSHCRLVYNIRWYMVRPSNYRRPKRGKVWIEIHESHCITVYRRLWVISPPPLLINPLAMGLSSGKQNINSDIMPPGYKPSSDQYCCSSFRKRFFYSAYEPSRIESFCLQAHRKHLRS